MTPFTFSGTRRKPTSVPPSDFHNSKFGPLLTIKLEAEIGLCVVVRGCVGARRDVPARYAIYHGPDMKKAVDGIPSLNWFASILRVAS